MPGCAAPRRTAGSPAAGGTEQRGREGEAPREGQGEGPGTPGGWGRGARGAEPPARVAGPLVKRGAAGGKPLPLPCPRPSLPPPLPPRPAEPLPERRHPQGCPITPAAPRSPRQRSPPRAPGAQTTEINRRDPSAVPVGRERARPPLPTPRVRAHPPRRVKEGRPPPHALPARRRHRAAQTLPRTRPRRAPARLQAAPGSWSDDAPLPEVPPPLPGRRPTPHAAPRAAPSLRRPSRDNKEGARPTEGASPARLAGRSLQPPPTTPQASGGPPRAHVADCVWEQGLPERSFPAMESAHAW